MHPILFTFPEMVPLIGGKSIHTYGFMIAIAFFLGMVYIKRESARVNLDAEKSLDLFFYIALSGMVGARLFYIFHSVDDYFSDPLQFFYVWEGGLVFQGGVILALLVSYLYVRKNQMPLFKSFDLFAPPLAIGHAIGRMGCFFAGCCFGKQCPTDFPLAIVFPNDPNSVAPHGVHLYPVQLFEVFGELAIFAILMTYRKKKPFEGSLILLYLMLYSVLRSFNEMFRGDIERGFMIDPYLSHGQFISIIMFVSALVLWSYLSWQKKKDSHEA